MTVVRSTLSILAIALILSFAIGAAGYAYSMPTLAELIATRKATVDAYWQAHKQGAGYTLSVTSVATYEAVRVRSGWHNGAN